MGDNGSSGRSTVRGTLVLVLALSMAANVGHTILAQSTIPTWLRMVGAVAWPLLVFLAVEILVRVIWQPRASHRWARALILFPAIPAAITSYEHMHAVLLAMGERAFIAAIGPAAIDVMMIGCTLTLLFTRQVAPQITPVAPEMSMTERTTPTEQEVEEILERYAAEVEELPYVPTPAELELAEQMAAANEVPDELVIRESEIISERGYAVVTPEVKVRGERLVRAGLEQQQKAIALLLDGREKEAVSAGLMGASTMRRYVRVKTMLRDTPALAIDCRQEKVRPELVDMIREWANDGRPYV